jgi:branched-chain amino acid transport system substrate-binding protein
MLQHGAGKFPVHADMEKYLYAKGKGASEPGKVGEVLYNRGMVNAMLGVEAIRKAQEKFGKKPLTGEQVRWGLENLNLSEARLKELGFEGMLKPITISCSDHEGARDGRVQQWDGKGWKVISDWYTANQSVTDPLVDEVSAKYAAEKKIQPRDCSKES